MTAHILFFCFGIESTLPALCEVTQQSSQTFSGSYRTGVVKEGSSHMYQVEGFGLVLLFFAIAWYACAVQGYAAKVLLVPTS